MGRQETTSVTFFPNNDKVHTNEDGRSDRGLRSQKDQEIEEGCCCLERLETGKPAVQPGIYILKIPTGS